ncbi:MAG: serine hydrolase [Candidatus Pacebacteria bacterium]|nr:serine hydrolase [Candidatus Paceibacterota bacterium]
MTSSNLPPSYPNPDLMVKGDYKPRWNQPFNRRHSFQNLAHVTRYNLTYRAAAVMELIPAEDVRIGQLQSVQNLINHPFFSGICVINGGRILFERYARDYDPQSLHSIQSVTKTMVNLLIGPLVESGQVKLDGLLTDYVPEVARGYKNATVQQTLNMDVENDYSEQFDDPNCLYYQHEAAIGWRLPPDLNHEESHKQFLARVEHNHLTPPSPFVKYKSSNTDSLAWLIERVSGKSLNHHLADIIDAAGIESRFAMSCDRDGYPLMDGGGCFTARDLARYGSIFTRGGLGVNGHQIGSKWWMEKTLKGGIPWSKEDGDEYRYSNQTETDGRAIAHAGYCGQYLYADLTSGTVVAHFSVCDQTDGFAHDHFSHIWQMMAEVTRL